MSEACREVNINGYIYVRKDAEVEGLEHVIIRTYSAGVFAGYLVRREGMEVELKNARRLWRWSGAATLSQLAMEGVKNPNDCKFPLQFCLRIERWGWYRRLNTCHISTLLMKLVVYCYLL